MNITIDVWAMVGTTFTLTVTLVGATWKVSSAIGDMRSELGDRIHAVEGRVSALEGKLDVLINKQ